VHKLALTVATALSSGIPLDSGLIFPFAGSVLGAVWFLSIWPNTQEYRYTRRRSTFGFRPGEYSNTGIEILSI